MDIEILYENDDVVVVNKPAGVVVTPGAGYAEEDTLVGWLIAKYGEDIRKVGVESHRPGIVHRIDKQTSGVLIMAKTHDAFTHLVSQFKKRKVKKRYLAVVWNSITKTIEQKGSSGKQFVIKAPIGRNPKNRVKFIVIDGGKQAFTKFKVLSEWTLNEFVVSTLVCAPRSGRTHQIRVHLKSFGHSVLGDNLYQSKRQSYNFRGLCRSSVCDKRMYLHAYRLSLVLPGENSYQTFLAKVPASFRVFAK